MPELDTFTTYLAGGEQKPYLWIGNEPTFAVPFMYNWTSQPHKTQALVRRILDKQFGTNAQGLPGNEDEGALSGWYVWSALGLYPQILAEPGLTLTSPLFSKAVMWQGNKKLLTISAPKAPAQYIQNLMVDGRAHDSTWLSIDPSKSSMTLDFALGDKPSCWASNPDLKVAPPSFASDGTQTPLLKTVEKCTLPR